MYVYGIIEQPPYKMVGRKPSPVIVPHSDLKYAQVRKKRETGRGIVEVAQHRFIRKIMNGSKNPRIHSRAIDFLQEWYNFVKPHKSLRVRVREGKRKWKKSTPAMAEGLTDHVWTLEELFTFRVPIQ